MKTLWIEKSFLYDGSQLRSLFAYLDFGVLGDSLVAWRGACDVQLEHMVDGEDLLAKERICGADMLHFILEVFHQPLSYGVAVQRLMASIVNETLQSQLASGIKTRREGDDVYWDEKKLSISIASVSPVSALVHFAVNISNQGTPVPTCALTDFALEPKAFAHLILERMQAELESIDVATKKVRWVR